MSTTNTSIDLKPQSLELVDGRLFGTATILGTSFHVEAFPVVEQDGLQVGVGDDADSRLNGLAVEFDSPGFETVSIDGRDYVLIIFPFER